MSDLIIDLKNPLANPFSLEELHDYLRENEGTLGMLRLSMQLAHLSVIITRIAEMQMASMNPAQSYDLLCSYASDTELALYKA